MGNLITTTARLDATQVNGKPALASGSGVLVRRDDAGQWQPVDKVDQPVDGKELVERYGDWNDRKVTTGHLWWKKTVRPLDGVAQPDEVKPLKDYTEERVPFAAEDKGLDWAVLNDAHLTSAPLGSGANLQEEWLVVAHSPPVHML